MRVFVNFYSYWNMCVDYLRNEPIFYLFVLFFFFFDNLTNFA